MLSQFLSDPRLTVAFQLIALASAIGVITVLVQMVREGRKAGVTTAAELRKDAQTSARQKSLRKMQGRAADRCAFSRRQDLRANRTEKAPSR